MDLTTSGYKQIAKQALQGNWGLMIGSWLFCIMLGGFLFSIPFLIVHFGLLVFSMYTFEIVPHYFILLTLIETILMLIFYFFGSALELGYIELNLAILDRRPAGFYNVFSRFYCMWKALLFRLIMTALKVISLCIFILPCFFVTFSYAMTPYIISEKSEYSVLQSMKISRKIMKGHKWELFCLRISFIGWYLLGFLTAGLGFFYAQPYIRAAEAVFYNEISGRAEAYYGR